LADANDRSPCGVNLLVGKLEVSFAFENDVPEVSSQRGAM
jgi:hypothetical protein